jgi:hypothetical protein
VAAAEATLGDAGCAFASARLEEESAAFDVVCSGPDGTFAEGLSFAVAAAAETVSVAFIPNVGCNETDFEIPVGRATLEMLNEDPSATELCCPEPLLDDSPLSAADW